MWRCGDKKITWMMVIHVMMLFSADLYQRWKGCKSYARSFLTMAEIALPSALPANCLLAMPITLPMSFMPDAPVEAMMVRTAASISSAERGLGRYSLMTSTCASSASASSASASLHIGGGTLGALLSQLLQHFHGSSIVERVVGSRCCLQLEKHFLDVTQ